MKKTIRIMALLLSIITIVSLSFVACTNDEPTVKESIKALAGDYYLDAAPYGMNMAWYINISEEGTFKISTKRDYSVDKGNGQISESNGTFVFLYSTSTNENAVTAEFKVENGNLVFADKVPIGSSNVSSDIEGLPVIATLLAYEEYLGEYVGSYEKESAMAGSIVYNYDLTLKAGKQYAFSSSFYMGTTKYVYSETGTFSIEGSKFTMTALKEVTSKNIESGTLTDIETPSAVEGTIADGKINVSLKASPMGSSRYDSELLKATTSEVSGVYYALKTSQMYTLDSALTLDKRGGYKYSASFKSGMMGNSTYAESGSFEITETGITLTPKKSGADLSNLTDLESSTPYSLTAGVLTYTGKVPTGGMATEVSLYHESVCGSFSANNFDSTVEGEPHVAVALDLIADGTCTIAITLEGSESPLMTISGTYTVEKTMYKQLKITAVSPEAFAGQTISGVVSASAIQISGFQVAGLSTAINLSFAK